MIPVYFQTNKMRGHLHLLTLEGEQRLLCVVQRLQLRSRCRIVKHLTICLQLDTVESATINVLATSALVAQ